MLIFYHGNLDGLFLYELEVSIKGEEGNTQ